MDNLVTVRFEVRVRIIDLVMVGMRFKVEFPLSIQWRSMGENTS